MKRFLEQGGFHAFTTTFEDLHGLKQLPGLAVQRLMQQGYGFAGEGDWKTAALLRIMKVMSTGLQGGTSFMEDYTYHFDNGDDLVLGSHMLEVCPTIATADKPILDVQPLGIGGKADPARLIFNTQTGPALVASLIDLGDRFRLLVNTVETVPTPHDLPKLPVANALWKAQPDLCTASEARIIAGGAHHTVFSHALTLDDMRQFAELQDIELAVIDNETRLPSLKTRCAGTKSITLQNVNHGSQLPGDTWFARPTHCGFVGQSTKRRRQGEPNARSIKAAGARS